MEKTDVKPGKVFRSAASRWCRECEAPFNTVLGIPGAVFLFVGEPPRAIRLQHGKKAKDQWVSLDRSLVSARLRSGKLQ